jgi:multicomponent Na+:H+ antiporter subunit E
MRALGRAGLLVVLWLLAWGDLSLANVVSGAAVAAAVLVAFPPRRPAGRRVRIRARGVPPLVAYVVSQLVVSNVLMTWQILRRRPDVRPGVLAHRLRHPSEETVTVMTSIIALSPGTMTADVDAASTTIYVHFFRLHDVPTARAALERLERLVTGAIAPPPEIEPVRSLEEAP